MKITTLFATLALAAGLLSSGCVNVAPNSSEGSARSDEGIRNDERKSQDARIAELERKIAEQNAEKNKECTWQTDRIQRYSYWKRGKRVPTDSGAEESGGRQGDTRIDSVRLKLAGIDWIETTQIEIPFHLLNERIIDVCPNPANQGKSGKLRYGGYDGNYTKM